MKSITLLLGLLVLAAPAGPARADSPRCHARGLLPDPQCTPGAVDTTDLAVVCGTSTKRRRHVTKAVRRQVLAAYGFAPRGDYEIDHLIPLELGGSNAAENLWPEPSPGFRDKDRVENRLHRLVCSGRMSLSEAQRHIARDWTTLQ